MSGFATARRSRVAWIALLALVGSILPVAAAPVAAADKHVAATGTTSTPVLAVSAGTYHTCAIRADGTIGCWGRYDYREQTPPTGTFTAVSAGYDFSCAINGAANGIECWGANDEGQATPPAGSYTTVSAGEAFACAITTDQALVCWGNNDFGQTTPRDGTYKAVDAGGGHVCAVRTTGAVDCWGLNYSDQAIAPAGAYSSVSAGTNHSCAIADNMSVVCWGDDYFGEATPPDGQFTAVSAGDAYTCGVRVGGALACWGYSAGGQATPPAGSFAQVTTGQWHSAAIASDGTLAWWGDEEYGQPRPTATFADLDTWAATTSITLGWSAASAIAEVTSYDVRYSQAPWNRTLGATSSFRSKTADTSATFPVTAGFSYCFEVRALDADNGLSSWSEPSCIAVPLDDRSLVRTGSWVLQTPADAYRATTVSSTAAGATLTRTGVSARWIALLATMCPNCGSVQLFLGSTTKPFRTVSLYAPVERSSVFVPILEQGELDENDEWVPPATGTLVIKVVSSGKPVIIDGLLTTIDAGAPVWADGDDPPVPGRFSAAAGLLDVSAGTDSTCGVRTDGSLACWGSNAAGKAFPPDGAFTTVSVGSDHACAIAATGALTCWGDDSAGQADPPSGSYVSVSSAGSDSCALDESGAVHCWGPDYGDGGEFDVPKGKFTSLGRDAVWDSFCAVRTTGSLACWGWGYADYGPLRAPTGQFSAVSGSCAIRADWTPVCWGDDFLPQLAPPEGQFKTISVSQLHACAIDADDSLQCWGDNAYFETAAPTGTFAAVTTGEHHTCAIRTGGAIECWGHNRSGQVVARPVAWIRTLASNSSTDKLSLSWAGKGLAPIASYDVRYRRAAWNGNFGSATTWRSATPAISATFSASPGSTYCYSALARDTDNVTSAWTAETCTAVPLDDRSLTRSGSWTAGTNSSYYRSTYLRSTSYGASLTRTGVTAKSIALLVTTCSTCGKVNVYWGSTLLKTVNLYSATTVARKLISVTTFSSGRVGTLKIKVVTSGKKVYIDGVAIRRL